MGARGGFTPDIDGWLFTPKAAVPNNTTTTILGVAAASPTVATVKYGGKARGVLISVAPVASVDVKLDDNVVWTIPIGAIPGFYPLGDVDFTTSVKLTTNGADTTGYYSFVYNPYYSPVS